jgi:lysozyme family protein
MANFDKIFNDLIIIEGGYSNHPMDRGGETKYGITKDVARENGYYGDMRNLSLEEARDIYNERFFKFYGFDTIQNTKIAGELFEFTVNTGRGASAVRFLQRAYNLLNKNITLIEDGKLGPKTAQTINSYKFYKSLYKVLNIFQGMYYIFLAENDVTAKEDLLLHKERHGSDRMKTFIRGWIDKRVTI